MLGSGTTVAEAAEAAGISRASSFRYLTSKEGAVYVAQEAAGAKIAAAVTARLHGSSHDLAVRWGESDGSPDFVGLLSDR